MKAFLMAAGKGTRLKPYTDAHPKCLIPIHGVPLLAYWLDIFERSAISDVLINTHHHADQVEQYIDSQRNCRQLTLHTVHEPELLGSAGTLFHNRDFVAGEPDFVIAYADNLTNLNLGKMIDFHKNIRSMEGILTMGLIKAPDPTACGIVGLDHHNRITSFVEKPREPKSDLANGGVYIAATDVFDTIESAAQKGNAVLDLGYDILPQLVGRMYGYPISDFLTDIGTPQSYELALRQWKALSQ